MREIRYICKICGEETKITATEEEYRTFDTTKELDALTSKLKKLCVEGRFCYNCFFEVKP